MTKEQEANVVAKLFVGLIGKEDASTLFDSKEWQDRKAGEADQSKSPLSQLGQKLKEHRSAAGLTSLEYAEKYNIIPRCVELIEQDIGLPTVQDIEFLGIYIPTSEADALAKA